METGPRFIVPSDGLENLATPGLQVEWHNHCTTEASQTVGRRNTTVMIATLRKQQSASTANANR